MDIIDIVQKVLHGARHYDLSDDEKLAVSIKGAMKKNDTIILVTEECCGTMPSFEVKDTKYEITIRKISSRKKKENLVESERNPKDPDALLSCYCAKCGGITPGKLVCWNTRCCPQCSDNYEPKVGWKRIGMSREEAMSFRPTEFGKEKW